jgi:ornithine--oxo-acid transaminase
VLVCDEIQTGLGRTGSWFASGGMGVRPGMMTVSKTLAGGQVPVSAVLLSEEVYEGVYSKFKSGPIYFSTFAENNLAMAAGIATIDVLRELDAPARAQVLGEQLRSGLIEIASRYDCIERISGQGLMLAIYFRGSEHLSLRVQQELIGAADSGAFATAVNCDMFAKQRIIVQIPGPEINAIKILPPITISEEDVRYFLGALDDTLSGYYKVGGPIVTLAGGLVKDTVRSVRQALPFGDKSQPKPVAAASPSAAHEQSEQQKKNSASSVAGKSEPSPTAEF